jgi:Mn-dependent DtxR family transcriptional regulator
MPPIEARAKKIRKHRVAIQRSMDTAVVITAEVSNDAEHMVHVVNEVTRAAIARDLLRVVVQVGVK